MSTSSIPYTVPLPGGIPDKYRPHTEQTTTILVPKANTAFLNPVQEYNRDLSVSVIRAWNDQRKEELEARWRANNAKKEAKGKGKSKPKANDAEEKPAEEGETNGAEPDAGASTEPKKFQASKITILEALSATGLRSIRYAKEIPDVKVVLANDLSPSACVAMRQNVALNGVGPVEKKEGEEGAEAEEKKDEVDLGRREGCTGYVHVNEGDACALMYGHRTPRERVDVVDLDPYGTAAPFIDAAIGCIADGGLLAVTCTDLAVLAGSSYPEKCFSNYGGVCAKAEYSHEVALRLVLNSLAQAAARYGRTITPLISLSIDFYVRLFIRVDSKPVEVKRLASQTGIVYICNFCETPVTQPFGKVLEKPSKNGDFTNTVYRSAGGPKASADCAECGSPQAVAGPMWLGPIQDPTFVSRVLKSIEADKAHYGTYPRMNGMLTMAHDELPDPFYFTSNKIHGFAHTSAGPTKQVVSALLNAGYKVSRSHAAPGSVKTNAPRGFVCDIVREHVKTHPVRMDKISETSPARSFVSKPMTHEVDLKIHPEAKNYDKQDKVVYYQLNPLPNWGPGSRARSVRNDQQQSQGGKRKAEEEAEGAEKKAKVVVDDEEAAMNA
ncbi:RNA methyltransferase tRNA(m5U54)methyltransferase [Vanrija albida]|uniref:tRNA (guanine(26)-N(2))-dimethyltransferase n=1 Tax=Vanrija albida TaxID=181172 RepID=A0ABR3PSH1_9TREE